MKKVYNTGYFLATVVIASLHLPAQILVFFVTSVGNVLFGVYSFISEVVRSFEQGVSDCIDHARNDIPILDWAVLTSREIVKLWNEPDGSALITSVALIIGIPIVTICCSVWKLF